MVASSLRHRFERNDRRAARFEVEDGITSDDYLQIQQGTRGVLYEKDRN